MLVRSKSKEDINRIIDYIGEAYYKSLYLYMDLIKYGVDNSEVNSWILLHSEKIEACVLKYHNGMHIFSKEASFQIEEIERLIKIENPAIICAESSIIKALSGMEGYMTEYGHVAKYMLSYSDELSSKNIRQAKSSDCCEMAKMLISDPDIGASYTLEEMERQIRERINEGYSRSFCHKINGKIVAQASTGAEGGGIATIAYVMVALEARGQGYGKSVVLHLSNELAKEGMETYLIFYSDDAGKLYLNNGFEVVCDYGKLYKRVDENETQVQ